MDSSFLEPETMHIFLPVYNRRKITRRFIQCLKKQTYRNNHLILIDDGSTDGTEEMVCSEIGNVTVIKGWGDWWWAGSLQQGYLWLQRNSVSPEDMVLIINDDTEFEEDFLEKGRRFLESHSNTMLMAQVYSRESGDLVNTGVHVDWRSFRFDPLPKAEKINCLSTRGLFSRIRDFSRVGGFYPKLLPHYFSDYEFTIRAQRKGIKLATDPSVRLWMDENASGYHSLNGLSVKSYLQRLLSEKTPSNPIRLSFFVVLSCPWCYMPLNLLRVWVGVVGGIFKRMLNK